ncbi:MAG TPA: SOS response-associated peptidase [Blastocatellia bacterium]|nr:SOS response-associated peptidase [Blastocatellia bacterium]
MCGRFTRAISTAAVAEVFGVEEVASDLKASYNIAPTNQVAVIVSDGTKRLIQVRWGLVPSWAKDLAIGNKLINARAETITEKASFRTAFKKRRCLVVADGFYEWQQRGDGKRPVYIRLKSGKPFGMAGLYEVWRSPAGEDVTSCAIITTQANELMQPIHERMPVIIAKDIEDLWLDPTVQDVEVLLNLLTPYPAAEMEAYPVSKRVNSPGNNSPECIKLFADK